MALHATPRKVVPLATGDELKPRSTTPAPPGLTKRVFFCGVVIEGSEYGRQLPDEIKDFVLSFGSTVRSGDMYDALSKSSEQATNNYDPPPERKHALTNTSALVSVINELVTSERSYVDRLRLLKDSYADPLRKFAKNKETAIIPLYDAKTLFGNIDNLIPVNEAFLVDLERMLAPGGSKTVGGVGDVALRHFRELRGFELYKQYYSKREDAQLIFERQVARKYFSEYIDRIKYAPSESKNRVGLRELLMEPVQRIPRYTLLFRTMLKHMSEDDPQRAKIIEADEIASKIALAEADEQTKRAAIFYCLSASIDGFPPDLFSNSRKFIDCIDVEDILSDPSTLSSSSSASSLHCTLFLFDDKLMIVKRNHGEKSGRQLAGLNDLDKVTKGGNVTLGKKKSGLICKGVIDITDVVATDAGGSDIHLYLENPLQDQSDRWSGRPFRSLAVVHPPSPINFDTQATEANKQRFLENFWLIQATYRARAGQSVVLCSEEYEVESKYGRTTTARTFYNVYQRTAFLQEPKKTKVVVHIDSTGMADPIPFGLSGPLVRIRVQLLAGGLCRYAVSASDPANETEEDIVQTERVPSRVVQTIHQFGLFQFKTGKNSVPSTPTTKSKVAIFGLDAISKGLFSSRPGSSMGDFLAGSINSHRHRRAKSTISHGSTYTHSTTTLNSSTKFSSSSSSTAPTSISEMDEETKFSTKSSYRSKKNNSKRGKPSNGFVSEPETDSISRKTGRMIQRSRSVSDWDTESDEAEAEVDDDDGTIMDSQGASLPSDWNLSMQLELARKNSQIQHNKPLPALQMGLNDINPIYEEEQNRYLQTSDVEDLQSQRSVTPTMAHSRSHSVSSQSTERRPMGPRSPSPLPPRTPYPSSSSTSLPSMDEELSQESTMDSHNLFAPPSRHHSGSSGIPRSVRQPFVYAPYALSTPKGTPTTATNPVEPLSIKKKSSIRSNATVTSPGRKTYVRASPLTRHPGRLSTGSPRRISSQTRRNKPITASLPSNFFDPSENLLRLSESAKDDIEHSRRMLRRIKLEFNNTRVSTGVSEPESFDRSVRAAPMITSPVTKAAQERLEEMRKLISKRHGGDLAPRKPRSAVFESHRPPSLMANAFPISSSSAPSGLDGIARTVESILAEVDKYFDGALSKQEQVKEGLQQIGGELKSRAIEVERARLELQSSKRQCEVVKSLLSEATAEKEIMYEAFNEELDGMYNDINLPDDEAWEAMTDDLRRTKESRNKISKENSQLRRRVAELESQHEEWAELLRTHGLLS